MMFLSLGYVDRITYNNAVSFLTDVSATVTFSVCCTFSYLVIESTNKIVYCSAGPVTNLPSG